MANNQYKATEKQVAYALALLRKAGYPVNFMSAEHKKLGATMKERSGRVSDWLAGMDRARISELIDQLK